MRRLALAAGLAWMGACGPNEKIIVLYPEAGPAARDVLSVEFMQNVTVPDNFVMRPDELGGVAVDHDRGVVYAGSRDGSLLALDLASGEVRWEFALGGAASSVPVLVDGETLLVGSDNGALVAMDLETRKPRWRYETQGTVRNTPVVGEGVVYFANSRDQLFALDIRSGAWRWQYEREFQTDFTIRGRAGLTFAPAPQNALGRVGTLYTGFDDGRVVAIDASSGQALWISSVAPPAGGKFVDCDSTPLLDPSRGELVVAGQQTGVYGLSLDDGAVRWHLEVRGGGTAIRGPDGVLLLGSSLQGLHGIEPGGTLRWRQPTDPGVLSTPVVVDDTVYVNHSESGLLAFDAREGELLARVQVGSGMSGEPVYDAVGGRLYVTSNRGMLLGLRVSETAATSGDDPSPG